MTVFLAILLTVITVTFIAYPLFWHRWAITGPIEDEKLNELNSKRDTTYSMLKELEFDFQSGILGEEDYRELKGRYKGKAISILRDIDGLDKNTRIDKEIERQVQQLRQKLIGELAQLDDNFKAGKITEDNYQKQQITRKAKLIELEQKNGTK